MRVQKSYEYFTRNGIERTPWFEWSSDIRDKYQFSNKLRNFYREVDDAEDEDA